MQDLLEGGGPDDGELTQVEEPVHHAVVELVGVCQVLLHPDTTNSFIVSIYLKRTLDIQKYFI